MSFLMEHKISQIEYLFLEMNFAPYYEAAYKQNGRNKKYSFK